MITVITFKWNTPGYRSVFTAEHVNTLQSMVSRHLTLDHRFVCITDDPTGLKCESFPLWDFPKIKSPKWKTNAYRCLKLFCADAVNWFNTEHVLVLDLDTVIVNDITSLIDLNVDFKIWTDQHKDTHYNSSIWLYRLASRTQVWDTFNPVVSPRILRQKNIMGSDQAWISHSLGANEQTWSAEDGILSFRYDLDSGKTSLPESARIVFFHGKHDPWHEDIQESVSWVSEHYR